MVARAGCYYKEPFHRDIGVTQGDPMLPTIFNVVVDAVVRHWKSLVSERAEEDSSYNEDDAAQPEGRTIQARDDGGRQAE